MQRDPQGMKKAKTKGTTKIDMYSMPRRVQSIAGQAGGILSAIHLSFLFPPQTPIHVYV